MKKHDEGYVLAYVTVVLLIFCLVATAILTGALRNLQSQQAANERMKHQYIAAGELEKVVSQWSTFNWEILSEQANPETKLFVGETNVEYLSHDSTEVTLRAESGTIAITCKIGITDGKFTFYEITTIEPVEEVPQ